MGFPEFDPARPSILYFCRGRGRGHAVPAATIAREVAALRPEAQLHFVSYGTGGRTLQELGFPVVDLGLPDDNSTVATTVLAGKLIGWLRPDLVVAHEEFAALPVAKIFDVPALMLTDFFPTAGSFWSESLRHAQGVLFLESGRGEEPEPARGRVTYVGPVLRRFEYRRRDRARARRELGLDPGAVVAVLPGSWTEARAPLVDRLLKVMPAGHQLIWLAGEDEELIRRKAPGALVMRADWQMERLMCAADLALTKCNRMTVRELAALGIRTLSVSYGLNPADEAAIQRWPGHRIIEPAQLTRRLLAQTLAEPEPAPVRFRRCTCAAEIIRWLERCRSAGDRASPARSA